MTAEQIIHKAVTEHQSIRPPDGVESVDVPPIGEFVLARLEEAGYTVSLPGWDCCN